MYDFLFVYNIYYGPILHRFGDTATDRSKIAEFYTPVRFNALAVGAANERE